MNNDNDARRLLRTALEVLWVQEQTIYGLMNAVHAMENLLRRDYPSLFSEYEKMKDETTSQTYPDQRSTIEDVERAMEFARKIAPPPSPHQP